MNLRFIVLTALWGLGSTTVLAQTLPLSNALQRSVQNYQKIKAKEELVKASDANINHQKSQYLPDVTLLAQQSFGTINAQNGPMYAYGGLGSAATSMPLSEQNWTSAFGSLYLSNVNWNLFTFGRLKEQVSLAKADKRVAQTDLEQEKFQQQVKVAAAYFSLLASQRVKFVQQKNLERAQVFLTTTLSRAQSGLVPGVDASLAKAEVSNAQSAQLKAYDIELDYSKTLSVLLGEAFQHYTLDSVFIDRLPVLTSPGSLVVHPYLQWQKSKIESSESVEKMQQANRLPNLSAFGVLQGRGSGFDWNYVQDNSAYSKSYTKGVGIDRGNYLLGLTLSWNLTNIFRNGHKVKEQELRTRSFKHDYQLLQEELSAQTALADAKYENAIANFSETNIQVKAASDAFRQNTALYDNGLTTIVDLTQALYALNRAEIDHEIAQNNVWQALLLKSAAQGDLNILLNAIPK